MHLEPHPEAATCPWRGLLAAARTSAAAALRLPHAHPDVEDRAQDTMVHFLARGRARFDPSLGTPEALVRAIARNCARDQLRRGAARARACDAFGAGAGSTGDAELRRAEARLDLGAILSRLSAGHAGALLSIDLRGERIADAARRLGRSYAAANAQVGHARAAARRIARELEAA
jgi:DNA-directed RNA polymerase specialized sigma24 family protein